MLVAHQQSYPQPYWVKGGTRDRNCLCWARLSPPLTLMLHIGMLLFLPGSGKHQMGLLTPKTNAEDQLCSPAHAHPPGI